MKCKDKVKQEQELFMTKLKGVDLTENAVQEAVGHGARGPDGCGVIYAPGTSPASHDDFRAAWKRKLLCAGKHYQELVSEEEHTKRLESMCQSLTDEHKNILANGSMRIGVVQKGLNLYLKTLWCSGKILYPPPHCTLDKKVLKEAWKASGLKVDTAPSWSRLVRVEDYESCIKQCKEAARKHECIRPCLENKCIQESQIAAVWELFVWNDLFLRSSTLTP